MFAARTFLLQPPAIKFWEKYMKIEKILLKNQKSFLILGSFLNPPVYSDPPPAN